MLFLISQPTGSTGMIIVVLVFSFLVYFIPSFIAFHQNKRNKNAILLLNIFLGWTLIGWIGALIWAVSHEQNHEVYRRNNNVSSIREIREIIFKR